MILYQYFQFPKYLFTDYHLSHAAMLLYMLMLDRYRLSMENASRWTDEHRGIFIYFTRSEAMRILEISDFTSRKIFKELQSVGLIKREMSPGGNRPARIYVYCTPQERGKNQPDRGEKISPVRRENLSPAERNSLQEGGENLSSEGRNSLPNKNNINKNDSIKNRGRENTPPSAAEEKELAFSLESMLDEMDEGMRNLYHQWIDYTVEIGKRLTVKARLIVAEKIEIYTVDYGVHAVRALIEEAVENGWKSLYFEKIEKNPHKYDPLRFAEE